MRYTTLQRCIHYPYQWEKMKQPDLCTSGWGGGREREREILLCVAHQTLSRILAGGLTHHLERMRHADSQCIFKHRQGTIDMIYAVGKIETKFHKQKAELYLRLFNFKKIC